MMTTTTATAPATVNTGTSTTLAPWSSNYVTSMLGQSSALAQQPYQWYQGALTSGSSPLQQQAFQGIGSLQTPGAIGQAQTNVQNAATGLGGLSYDPTNISTGQWNQQAAQQYMNPYLQEALNPQLDEARRQAQITRMGDASRLTQAGAFGGSRQAIMESELNRNLMQNMSDITGKGYYDAYNTGMEGFMKDQGRALDASKATEQSKQFGAQFGMDALKAQGAAGMDLGRLGGLQSETDRANLAAQLEAGGIQRGIEQQGLDAEYQMWAQAQQHPYQSLEFMKSMLSGIPTVIDQGNPMDNAQRLVAALGGAKSIGDSGLLSYLQSLIPQG
jgi:hypothetical protein